MNLFNTDSGFRPPSPLTFSAPSHGLFGEPLAYDDFKFPNQDFLNLPTSPPPPPSLGADPSMQLFNPSEQRYFSEFLDTLVVDQDFTFDPSSIPNLPNLPLFTPETMPGGFSLEASNSQSSTSASLVNPGLMMMSSNSSSSMDFDMTSPSSQSSFSLPTHFNHGGFSSPQQQFQPGESPVSPGSPSSMLSYPSLTGKASISSKRTKTNKGTDAKKTDSSRLSTPIQQLSNLSLNGSSNSSNSNGSHRPSNPKKNKRDEDEHPASPSSLSSRSRESKDERRERHASTSDGSVSDATNSTPSTTPTPSTSTSSPVSSTSPSSTVATTASGTTTKRKPYKELLTEEEKRANHIASEQKRRNTIRNGFKDMTDIIPDLKDVNSSKSTILFKAVDFIKHLEKRNRMLQEKANQLESRLMNERNGGGLGQHALASGLEDQRLQDIPHIYPVSCTR
ncbi:hypothetical protein BGZ51_008517 [Haplosporangium sp. Z 767]|nr:hypothetical protein BGZ51_008517 [Haplosporangium sp. Z 767]